MSNTEHEESWQQIIDELKEREAKLKAKLEKAVKQRKGYISTSSTYGEIDAYEHIAICDQESEGGGE